MKRELFYIWVLLAPFFAGLTIWLAISAYLGFGVFGSSFLMLVYTLLWIVIFEWMRENGWDKEKR